MEQEKLQEILTDIFAPIIIGGLDTKSADAREKGRAFNMCLPKFKEMFSTNIFENEYAFFYSMIMDCKLNVFYEVSIEKAIETNRDFILNSPYIDIDSFIYGFEDSKVESQTDDMKLYAFQKEVTTLYKELSNHIEPAEIAVQKFESACKEYAEFYTNKLKEDIPHKMARIMSLEGYRVRLPGMRTKLYKGYDDACEYFRSQDRIIRELEEAGGTRSNVIDQEWLDAQLDGSADEEGAETIGTGLEEIDEVVGTIRRSNMVGILGPPKGGKTRFTTHLVARYLEAGYNVAIWPLEGTMEEWLACLESNIVYNSPSQVYIDSKSMIFKKYSEEHTQAVNAAKVKLAIGKDRGKLSFIKGVAYSEDFIDVLKAHYETENQFDVIVIDSPVLILSRKGIPKADRISSAYEQLKIFISYGLDKKIVALLPAQLKQSVVDYLRSHPNETMDVTAGGESAATVRSPDYIWGLFSSKEERNNGMMKIYDVGARHNGNFGDFYARCKLGCCHFWYDPELNNVFRG